MEPIAQREHEREHQREHEREHEREQMSARVKEEQPACLETTNSFPFSIKKRILSGRTSHPNAAAQGTQAADPPGRGRHACALVGLLFDGRLSCCGGQCVGGDTVVCERYVLFIEKTSDSNIA